MVKLNYFIIRTYHERYCTISLAMPFPTHPHQVQYHLEDKLKLWLNGFDHTLLALRPLRIFYSCGPANLQAEIDPE